MDATSLDIPDENFDAVIIKGTMDAILCGEGSTTNVAKMCAEVSRSVPNFTIMRFLPEAFPPFMGNAARLNPWLACRVVLQRHEAEFSLHSCLVRHPRKSIELPGKHRIQLEGGSRHRRLVGCFLGLLAS